MGVQCAATPLSRRHIRVGHELQNRLAHLGEERALQAPEHEVGARRVRCARRARGAPDQPARGEGWGDAHARPQRGRHGRRMPPPPLMVAPLLKQLAIFHPGRADRLAPPTPQAAAGLRLQRGVVGVQASLFEGTHEGDPAARRVGLGLGLGIRGAHGQAEAARDARREQVRVEDPERRGDRLGQGRSGGRAPGSTGAGSSDVPLMSRASRG